VDTGMADCYSKSFVEKAQESADLIGCDLGYAVGSNHCWKNASRQLGRTISGCGAGT